MAKRDTLKDQLKKAAKKRLARGSMLAPNETSTHSHDLLGSSDGGHTTGSADATTRSTVNKSLDLIINVILTLDQTRNDLNDRAILVGLKSVLRGYAGNEPTAAAVYHAVVEAKTIANLQARPMKVAIEELLETVTAYGSDRQTPRAALTYLHSVAS